MKLLHVTAMHEGALVLTRLSVVLASLLLATLPALAQTIPGKAATPSSAAPGLTRYSEERVYGELWNRRELSPRDRSIVTLAALIARNQTAELPAFVSLALDNGVQPREISEILTHLAFYGGRGNALAAEQLVRDVFAQRGITAAQLSPASPKLLDIDEVAEKQRAEGVTQQLGSVAPGVVRYTTEVLFRDLWLRPDLAPRDRSLITVSALIANGQTGQMAYHLNRAMDTGLTREQASEVLTQLAFYVGWPNVFSALPVARDVFEKRSK
jgi:4-carboxymuconolactone decarboxylase